MRATSATTASAAPPSHEQGPGAVVTPRALGTTAALCLLVGAIGVGPAQAGAGAPAHLGTVVGAIRLEGGPAPTPGYPRPSEAGTVTVFNRAGRRIASQRVRAGHDFRFRLRPGRYELNAGTVLRPRLDCPPVAVRVRADHTTHADVGYGCFVP